MAADTPHISKTPGFQELGRAVSPQYLLLLEEFRSHQHDAGVAPPNIVMFGDFGRDADDDIALQFLAKMHHLGLCVLKGVIANVPPAELRARQAKQILVYQGLGNVPVAVGSNGTDTMSTTPYPTEFSEKVLRDITADPDLVLPSGQELLRDLLEQAVATGELLTILCATSARDLAIFLALQTQASLFCAGVSRMVLQGGHVLDQDGHMIPYGLGANNAYDMPAAEVVYRFAQANGISTSSHLKSAAHVAPLPASTYQSMRESKDPTLTHCADTYFDGTQHFWERACGPVEDRIPGIDGRWCLEKLTQVANDYGEWDMMIAAEMMGSETGNHVDITIHLSQQGACDLLAAMDTIPGFMHKLGMLASPEVQNTKRQADQAAWCARPGNAEKAMPIELLDHSLGSHCSLDRYSVMPSVAVTMQASAILDTAVY